MKEFWKNFTENKFIFWTIFALIILGGFCLRMSIINFPLWYDEGCSIATAVNSFPSGINNYLWTHDLQHTPFYFYILHFIMRIFGDSEFVLRFSSVIVSMALLPLTYIVTEKLSSKKIGLIAMLLMAVNTFQVLYSIEIRMYPYVILLSLLSVNYLIDYDRKSDISSLIKLGIVNVLNPYFLTGSIIFVIAQFIIYSSYLEYKKADDEKIKKYMLSSLFMLVLYIPYFISICHYAIVRLTFLVTDLTPFKSINFWGLLQNLFACDPGHIHETRHEVFPKNYYTLFLVWVPVGMMFTGLINSLRDKEKLNTVILLVISLSFGLFLFAANSRVIAFTGRYLIFISPFIFILTAIGLAKLDKYLFAGLIIFYSIACLYGLKSTYNQYWRIAYYSLKAPAEFVKDHYSGKDNLVIMPFASSVSFYYYKDKDMPEVLPLELFHEVRNPNNPNFYNNEQQKGFKAGKKYEVFQKIILGKKPISENFVNFMHSYIDKVPKGGYVIWIVYYTDNYAIIPEEKVQAYYSDIKNVKEHTMTGVMSKFDIDLINMLSKQFNFVWKTRDDSNSYFIFQKR